MKLIVAFVSHDHNHHSMVDWLLKSQLSVKLTRLNKYNTGWHKSGYLFDKRTVIIGKTFFKLADKNSTNIIWCDLKSSKDVHWCVDDWMIDDDW